MKIGPKFLSVIILISTFLVVLFFIFRSPLEMRIKSDVLEKTQNYSRSIELLKQYVKVSEFDLLINPENLNKNVQLELDKLIIKNHLRYVTVSKNKNGYYFISLTLSDNLHLEYSDLENDIAEHEVNGFIETWRINKQWSIWKDNDYI